MAINSHIIATGAAIVFSKLLRAAGNSPLKLYDGELDEDISFLVWSTIIIFLDANETKKMYEATSV